MSRFVFLLLSLSFVHSTAFAAKHTEVTPFDALQQKFVLKAGQSYLEFMKKQVKPALDSFEDTINNDPASQKHNYGQLQTNLITQGAGVAIRIDDQNYIFNVGYLDGSDVQNDLKSGRSYGVGPTGAESDPSDLAYLKELEAYLQSEPASAGTFVETILKVLTDCDTSGWSTLSEAGQIVATDFVAIYTAELDRHLMVSLDPKKHPWEIDLAAATFVSVFDTASGKLMQNGKLVDGSIQSWWAKGAQGSGIGETRRDRIALQNQIAKFESESAETQKFVELTSGAFGKDVIQGVLTYLNDPTHAPVHMSQQEAKDLTSVVKNYVLNIQAHSSDIVSQE